MVGRVKLLLERGYTCKWVVNRRHTPDSKQNTAHSTAPLYKYSVPKSHDNCFKQQLFCTLGVSLKSSQNLIVSYKYMCLDRLVYASCSSLMIIILGAIHFPITGRKAEADLSSTYLTSHFSVIFSIPHKQQCLTFPLPYFPKPNFLSPLSVITHYFLCFLPFFLAFT